MMVPDKCPAERSIDIVQDIFLKLWQKRTDFNTHQNVKAFLYISTRNACFNYLKQAQYLARVQQCIRYGADDSQPSILHEMVRAEVLRELFGAIDTLPAKCRNIFTLFYKQGKTTAAISRELQITSRTVINQRARGLYPLRRN
jgi:RNA polymerase sigma-70 factor (ECF subfamily)